MWSSFVAIFHKEFIHIRRDKGTLALALTLPVFQLLLFGFIDMTVTDLPTIVADQDQSRYSRELIEQLRATGTFSVTRITTDPHAARHAIVSHTARVGIVIPPDYHRSRAFQKNAEILVFVDGSDSNVSAQAVAAVNGLTTSISQSAIVNTVHLPIVSAHSVILFNPTGRTANFLIPGLIAILLQLVAIILASVAIVREKEQGTLEQLMVTPIHPLGLILGKLSPYLVVGLAEMTIVLILMRYGFDVPIRGSIVLLFFSAIIYMVALLSLGLFISTRVATQIQAQQMAQLFFLPSIFLSGYIYPVEGLPAVLYWIGRLLPATHMIEILRGVILRDAGILDLLPHIGALFAISAVLVWISARSVKKTSG